MGGFTAPGGSSCYEFFDPSSHHASWGYVQLINVHARALGGRLEYPTCFCSAGSVDYWLQAQWEAGKKVSLADFDPALAVVHIPHGPLTANWNGARGARPNGLHNHDHWWHFSERALRTWFENLGLEDIGFANTIRDYKDNKLMDYHVVAVKPA